MAIITGMSGRILGQTDVSAAFADEACTDVSPAATPRTVYRITDRTLASWDDAATFTVQVDTGGGFATVTNYTLQYLGGVITFDAALGVGDAVQVSGNAFPMAAFTFFQSWELNGEVAMLDVTSIGDTAEVVTPGLLKGDVKADGFFVDSYFADKLLANAVAVLSLDTGAGTYDMYSYVAGLTPKVSKGAMTTEGRKFTVNGNFYFNAP